ncbi:MAG: DUF2282 domain-containing protein [Alphaproteobacteria bacterium]
MKKILISAALAGILAASAVRVEAAEDHTGKEKCFGIAKAGKNDCRAVDGKNSCRGHSMRNNDPYDWQFVEKNTCEKLGGALEAGKKTVKKHY